MRRERNELFNEHIDHSLLTMVQNIDLIASGNLKKLSKLCNVNVANIGSMIKQIKLLNHKPTNGFYVEQTSYNIPDVILTSLENGTSTRITPRINAKITRQPRILRANQRFYEQQKGKGIY